jgi:hypothetical protein
LCQSTAKAEYRPCRVTPNESMCFARWQSERRGAGCWSRLADASWLVAQFDRRWCATATAKLHNAALHKVHGQSVASSFCVPAPLRALRVYAAGVMQNCLRWSGRQSSALPGRFAPYAPPPVALVVCWHRGISQALRAWFWSAASPCIWCLPPPTPGARLLRSFTRAVCPSAPRGGSLRTARRHAA